MPTEARPAYALAREDLPTGVRLRLEGAPTFDDLGALWRALADVAAERPDVVEIDLRRADDAPGGALMVLAQAKHVFEAAGARAAFVGVSDAHRRVLDLYDRGETAAARPKRRPEGAIEQVGRGTAEALREAQRILGFVGDLVVSFVGVVRRPGTANWREIPATVNRVGADAVPIVVLINFLVGFVMAFQSAAQLKQFGANIYVADLVGLSITRELGPLMTAIIVCGRSGAAFAAELGTMKVSEEIDALRTMGFGPLRYLVFPRLVGLFLAIPILTLIADVCGLAGGVLVGVTSLDLTFAGYLHETQEALRFWDVGQGLVKAGVFAVAVALVACQQGLATTGGAEGVGQRTTSSVVTSLFALIVIDAGFAVLFHALDL